MFIVFISQSGETMDLIKHLPFLKSKSHKTMGIINVIDSSLAREVDGGIYMNVGRKSQLLPQNHSIVVCYC